MFLARSAHAIPRRAGGDLHCPLIQRPYPAQGQLAVSPGPLPLVIVLRYSEGVTDRQAADAVRRRIDDSKSIPRHLKRKAATKTREKGHMPPWAFVRLRAKRPKVRSDKQLRTPRRTGSIFGYGEQSVVQIQEGGIHRVPGITLVRNHDLNLLRAENGGGLLP
jgi:hypothetical protein